MERNLPILPAPLDIQSTIPTINYSTSDTIFNATALVVWLSALLKLLGHAVKLGGCLAINVVSFPAIKNSFQWDYSAAALGLSWPAYGVSGFWTMRPRESQKWVRGWEGEETDIQKDRRRKQVSLATGTKPKKRNLHSDPMRDIWLIASLRSNITTRVWPYTAARTETVTPEM